MAIAYQYNASGYYVGPIEDYGLLPSNATYTAPTENAGYVPHWTGSAWELVEDHKGKSGYVNGQPHTINEYGPLPDGWSDTPPPLSGEDLRIERKMTTISRLAQIDSESIRPLRAKLSGTATADDDARILALENEASQLREELARIMSWQT